MGQSPALAAVSAGAPFADADRPNPAMAHIKALAIRRSIGGLAPRMRTLASRSGARMR
jgi:hypothetical protein